jgi:hypothetical protein
MTRTTGLTLLTSGLFLMPFSIMSMAAIYSVSPGDPNSQTADP